jgi:hypothetical protein
MTGLLDEASRLLEEASRRGLVLKLAGSAGVIRHCDACATAVAGLGREPPGDLDFFGYRKQERPLGRMFADLGYRADPSVAFSQEYGIDRLIYLGRSHAAKIDVFLDALRMSHTVQFGGRLDDAGSTAQATDLLLAKLQIHELTEKDVKDIAALLTAHPPHSDATIDVGYVTGLMSRDWGFCYTVQENLKTARSVLTATTKSAGTAAIEAMAELGRQIETVPKSLRWKARARVGTRVRWYEEVGDAELQGQGSLEGRKG